MSRRAYLIAATALAGLVFLFGVSLANSWLAGVRVDFTQNNLFTLSKGTRTVLSGLAEPVELTLVYTPRVGQDYPAVRAYADRVRETLASYKSLAGARLIVREIDPEPFSEAEDEALASGVAALPTDGGDPLYFGVIGRNAVDDEIVIPFLSPERETSLEYDLTRLVSRLDDPDPAVLGIITTLDAMSGDGQETGARVLQDMAKSFQIVQIPADFVAIPDEIDVLVLAHPPDLTPRQSWLIDQFALSKGRILAFLDPAAKAAAGRALFDIDPAAARSGLGRLERAWGVSVSRDAVADAANALPVQAGEEGRSNVVGQPLFIAAPPETMNARDLATADLRRAVHFAAPGAVLADPPDGARFRPLVQTGEAPSFIDAAAAAQDMAPGDVVRAYDAADVPLILAGRLFGSLKTAFPDGPPPLDLPDDPALAELAIAAAGTGPDHRETSEGRAEIVIVADTDLLDDGFFVDPASGEAVADNAAFVLNALDGLAGDAALLTLRARAPGARPMTTVEEMRRQAEARYFEEQARLEDRLTRAEQRLAELRAPTGAGGAASGDLGADLSAAEQAELADLREEMIEIRGRLRAIERDFRRDIDRLEGVLKAVNIWGGPLLVCLIGLYVWRRRARRPA